MAYLVNMDTFRLHDENATHTKNYKGSKYQRVNTISEARALASKEGEKLKPCKRCGFNDASKEECTK